MSLQSDNMLPPHGGGSPDLVPGLDPAAAERWSRLPRHDSPWLHEEVAARMLPRLDFFRQAPTSWLHWEPVAGGLKAHHDLCLRLPEASCLVWARDAAMAVRSVNAGRRRSWNPLRRDRSLAVAAEPSSQVDMLWANMLLHREPQPLAVLQQWNRHVGTGGFLMFSCLGPDSLAELRAVYRQCGWGAPTHDFVDMHDWGDLLVQAGFAEPVVDMERITLTYSSAQALLDELRQIGRNFGRGRFPGLRGRGWHRQLLAAIEDLLPRTADGRLQLGFEIVYGHAYKAEPRSGPRSEQNVSVEAMREMLRSSRR
ncbi:MAG: biotin synthase [Burkholderiaceae bacterium]